MDTRRLGIAVLLALAFVHCKDEGAYVFIVRQYDTSRDCLGPEIVGDVLAGADPGAGCPAMCLPSGDAIFVTTQCPPLPPFAEAGTSEACVRGLDALAKGRSCVYDAGGSPSDAPSDVASDVEPSPSLDGGQLPPDSGAPDTASGPAWTDADASWIDGSTDTGADGIHVGDGG